MSATARGMTPRPSFLRQHTPFSEVGGGDAQHLNSREEAGSDEAGRADAHPSTNSPHEQLKGPVAELLPAAGGAQQESSQVEAPQREPPNHAGAVGLAAAGAAAAAAVASTSSPGSMPNGGEDGLRAVPAEHVRYLVHLKS